MSNSTDRCEVCHGLVDEEDLFCANCGAESPSGRPASTAVATTAAHNFDCQGCGASMSYDASAQSLRCPFCGSTRLDERPDARVLAPSRVVPFRLDREAARQALRQWLASGFWRPGDLARTARIEALQAVYVPYWVFGARTHTYWTADTDRTPPGSRAGWRPLAGERRGEYGGLMVGASGALTPAETQAIAPFDLSAATTPDAVDLDNATFEQFRVPRKYARPLARQGLEELERQACRTLVPGQARNVRVNLLVEGLTSEPMLFPVWVLAYRYQDRVYRFVINGQTGRATGMAPTSWAKVALAIGLTALAVLAALGLLALCAGLGSAR